jgi:hypothetical protein
VAFEQHPCPGRTFKLFWSPPFFLWVLGHVAHRTSPQKPFELPGVLSVIFCLARNLTTWGFPAPREPGRHSDPTREGWSKRSCPHAWCSLWMATTIAGQGRACPVATAGNPTMGLSLMGALVSSVM